MATAKMPVFVVLLSFAALSTGVLADEVVHFTNGAEMPVRSHVVTNGTVKLDLGDNSFIAFPMSMVEKIDGAGQSGFVDPAFHPSNQVVAEGAGGAPVMSAKFSGQQPGAATEMSAVGKASPGWAAPSTATGGATPAFGDAAARQSVDSLAEPRAAISDSERFQRYLNPGSSGSSNGEHPVMIPSRSVVTPPKRLMAIPSTPVVAPGGATNDPQHENN